MVWGTHYIRAHMRRLIPAYATEENWAELVGEFHIDTPLRVRIHRVRHAAPPCGVPCLRHGMPSTPAPAVHAHIDPQACPEPSVRCAGAWPDLQGPALPLPDPAGAAGACRARGQNVGTSFLASQIR